MGGSTFAVAPTKVERKKLYGWTELRATDPDGVVCQAAGLKSATPTKPTTKRDGTLHRQLRLKNKYGYSNYIIKKY